MIARGRFGSEVHEVSPRNYKSGPLLDVEEDDDAPNFGDGVDLPYNQKFNSGEISENKGRKIELIVENKDADTNESINDDLKGSV